jgi:AraC-like DNA-binding protein
MQAHFVKLSPGEASLLAFERTGRSFPFYWHYHPEFEMTLIVDSQGQRLVGDNMADYGPGDLVLLGPNLPHTWRSQHNSGASGKLHRAVVIQFGADFLGKAFFGLPEFSAIRDLFQRSEMGLDFGPTNAGKQAAVQIIRLPNLDGTRRILSLLDILLHLAVEQNAQRICDSVPRLSFSVKERRRIDAMCNYLGQHFSGPLDYKDLSRKVQMEQASLCRFFKRVTGRTITTYVNELRIGEATRLLMETDESTLEIAMQAGFGNYSNFLRQFQRIKRVTPSAFRRQLKAPTTSAPGETVVRGPVDDYSRQLTKC